MTQTEQAKPPQQTAHSATQDPGAPGVPATPRDRKSRAGAVSGGLALILAIIALVGTAYLWNAFIQKRGFYRADVFGRLDQLEENVARQQEAGNVIDQRLTTLQETQDTLKTGIERLHSEFGRGRGEWLLAETEQLLLVANNRLQLARDVRLALAALRTADRQLQQLANPALLPVRRTLAGEISQLESLEGVDVAGMALRLGMIASRVDRLPFAVETRFGEAAAPDAKEPPRSAWRSMWQDLTSLIRIRRSGEAPKPLLAPEQSYMLKQNLRLMLYGAQVALLHGDVATFTDNTGAARRWIAEYFDTSTQVVQTTLNDLDQILKTRLKTDLPDISASLEQLRRITGRKVSP